MTTPEHTTNTPAAPAENADGMAANASVSAIFPAPETRDIDQTPAPRPPAKFLGFEMPGPVPIASNYLQEKFWDARKAVISALPAFIVNHGSNSAALVHTVSEIFMFKANGTKLLALEPKDTPHNVFDYIKAPFKNIYGSVLNRSKLDVSAKDLVRPSFYTESFKNHIDLKKASEMDRAHGPLINRWQARATLFGMTAWLLTLLLPDKKDTPEETQRMSSLLTNHPILYVGERLKQAVWVPDWWQHKRQMLGLGIMLASFCSILGGWRNVSRPKDGPQTYFLNWEYCATGLMSFMASIPMLFAVDNEKGYSLGGSVHALRSVFLIGSIRKKYKNSEGPQAHFYTTGAVGFQIENAVAALIGGAEKLPDGTVVDQTEIRNNAKKKALEEKRAHAANRQDFDSDTYSATPTTTITNPTAQSKAMPERDRAADEQAKFAPA